MKSAKITIACVSYIFLHKSYERDMQDEIDRVDEDRVIRVSYSSFLTVELQAMSK